MPEAARRSLEKRLGDFLGFQDDSLSDVLDHLLSIEGSDDLLDYLSQLLGDDQSDDIKLFVEDIGKFQRGEEIDILVDETITEDVTGTASTSPASLSAEGSQQGSNMLSADILSTKRKSSTEKETSQTSSKNHDQPASASPAVPAESKTEKTNHEVSIGPQREKAKASPPIKENSHPSPIKRGPPPRGKASRNCGCFGTLHKPLTNCLYCGRISCEMEGYDFCPFCGFLVEEVKPLTGEASRYVVMSLLLCGCACVLLVCVT